MQHPFLRIAVALCALGALPSMGAAEEMTRERVKALEASCETAREARIKPLRDAEIQKCQAQPRNDPAWCTRFWADYGNAMRRPDGTMGPRMFHDLPECLAAEKARTELATQ